MRLTLSAVGIRGRDSFKGQWLDMQPLVDQTKYDMSDFDKAIVDFFFRVEGEGLQGMPFGFTRIHVRQ